MVSFDYMYIHIHDLVYVIIFCTFKDMLRHSLSDIPIRSGVQAEKAEDNSAKAGRRIDPAHRYNVDLFHSSVSNTF